MEMEELGSGEGYLSCFLFGNCMDNIEELLIKLDEKDEEIKRLKEILLECREMADFTNAGENISLYIDRQKLWDKK